MNKLTFFLFFSWTLTLFSTPCFAQKVTHEYLENLAKDYVIKNIAQPEEGTLKVQVTPIDPRIKITTCNQPLKLNIPENHNSRNINVKISCLGNTPWQIYIPTKITLTTAVVITKQYIAKGSQLTPENIEVVYKDVSKIRGEYYRKLNKVVGNKALKSLSKGRTISPNNICLVCKGESVTINASRLSFTIKTAGKALTHGTMGALIKVKNSRSGRIISARINGENQVEIN